MFTEEIGVRIADVSLDQMESNDAEIALVKLKCEVNPFTAARAQDVHDFVRGTLFTLSGAEVNDLLGSATFRLAIPPQRIEVRMAPDQEKPSFVIEEAKVDGIKAKRSKKSSAWTLEFTVTCAPVSEHHLAQLCESYLKSKYMAFSPAEPGLFDETPEVKGRGVSRVEVVAGDTAQLH